MTNATKVSPPRCLRAAPLSDRLLSDARFFLRTAVAPAVLDILTALALVSVCTVLLPILFALAG